MNIKSIKIKNFKSVHSEQTVEFSKNGLITFIGKNGSGKSNVLEAVYEIFKLNNARYYDRYRNIDYSVILELDNATLKELAKDLDYDQQARLIEVYNNVSGLDSDSLKVNVMRSPIYVDALKKAADEVKNEAAVVSEKLKDFEKTLSEIKVEDGSDDGYFYTIDSLKESPFCSCRFNLYRRDVASLIEDVDGIVETILENEREIELYRREGYEYEYRYASPFNVKFEKPDFKVTFREPRLTDFDKKFVTVDSQQMKRVIDEINEQITAKSSDLQKAVEILNGKIEKFCDLIIKARDEEDDYYSRRDEKEKKKQSFLQRVRNSIARRCYYIPATEQFGSRGGYDYDYDRRYDYDSLLTETYITLKFDGKQREKILTAYEKERSIDKVLKELGISKSAFAADFEAALNKNLPDFDRDMITKIEVRYKDGLQLFVNEKDGAQTPFKETSTGRRWYFAYYFIKSCLKKNDILILDEPGVFLHPEAQAELLRELQELAKENTVIMCTHSPYMISETSAIHHVHMTENGTVVSPIEIKSFEKHYKNAGLSDFNSITINNVILNISNELILCEGERDIACIKAFMDYFEIDKKKYSVMHMTGWTHAQPLIEFYVNNNVNVRILLDKDAEEQIRNKTITVPSSLSVNRCMKIGDIPEERLTLAYAGSAVNRGKDTIEGLFSDNDRATFLEQVKGEMKVRMNIGEILSTKKCDQLTCRHFKALFRKLKLLPEKKGASN